MPRYRDVMTPTERSFEIRPFLDPICNGRCTTPNFVKANRGHIQEAIVAMDFGVTVSSSF